MADVWVKQNFTECERCLQPSQVGYIQLEVSEDGEHFQVLGVCSDECLEIVQRHWKQTVDIVHLYHQG